MDINHECRITATTKITVEGLFVTLKDIEVDFSCEDFDAIMSEQGLTHFGYEFYIKVFADAISNFAKSAGRIGIPEGLVISNVIKALEANLVDTEMKEPIAEAGTR